MRSSFLGGVAAILPLSVLPALSPKQRPFPVDFPLILGASITERPAAARRIGWPLHFLNAGIFGLGYRVAFDWLRRQPNPTTGALLGLAHGLASSAFLAVLPAVHPHPKAAGLPSRASDYPPRVWAAMLAGHMGFGMLTGKLLERRPL